MRITHSGLGVEPVICTRKSRFSTDYQLEWGDESADVRFGLFRGGGAVVHKGATYDISQTGPLGRVWRMKNEGSTILRAERKGLRSSIRIDSDEGHSLLERKHLLGSAFRLTDPEDVVAEFEKPHAINGSSEISVLNIDADFLTLCFAFWLVTTVRRASTGNL